MNERFFLKRGQITKEVTERNLNIKRDESEIQHLEYYTYFAPFALL